MQLKATTEWAIRILIYLCEHHGARTNREIAGALGISECYLPRVMLNLRRAGWVYSTTGSAGGYMMKVKPESITLLEVLGAMDGGVHIAQCLNVGSRRAKRGREKNSVKKVYSDFQKQTESYFSGITIAHLLDSAN